MSLKNSNTVALERRMDLASLFCMIGRHGPAVALAVIAMVSVLAGFIIYRTVKGKRRKATAAASAAVSADSDSKSPGAKRDASVTLPGPEPSSPEESHSSVESTDASDEGLSDMKEDADLLQTDLKIRHRRATAAAAAEKKLPSFSPPNKHTTSDNTEDMTDEQDSYKAAERYTEEASHNLQSDSYTVAGKEVERAGDCHLGVTDDTVKDVIEEVSGNDSCLKEPELINDQSHKEEEEKVFKAEDQGDVIVEKDVLDENTRQEKENFQSASNPQVCSDQISLMSENDDRRQVNKTTPETIHKDAPATCISNGKDEEFKEENHHPDSTDYSNYPSNNLSPEEEEKNECEEAEEECVDQQLILQQDETWSSTSEQEPNLQPSQQEQCDYATGKVKSTVQDSDMDDDVVKEIIDEDHVLTAAKFDTHPPQSDKQQLQTEQKEENGLPCYQEDGVLPTVADQAKEEVLTSDDTVACGEECISSSVELGPNLHCLNEPVNDDLSGVTADANTQISGIEDFADLSFYGKQPQSEVKDEQIAAPLEKDTGLTILGSHLPSLEEENQCNKNETSAVVVLVDGSVDVDNKAGVAAAPDMITCDAQNIIAPRMDEEISHPHVLSCNKDQQTINNEALDKASADAVPDTIENGTASVTGAEMSCSHLPSTCESKIRDHVEISETFEVTGVISASDAAVCDNASITTPVMSEAISRPDMLSFSQDQLSDQMRNDDDFSEFTTGAAPVMTEDLNPPMCQIHLTSFEQSGLRDIDKDSMSSPGAGEESGISSMTISPDLHDAGNEFGMTVENRGPPLTDSDPRYEERTEAQISLFADDVAIPVINQNTAGRVFGAYPSLLSQQPHSEHTDGAKYESFAANEDMFGHEIEDSYHRAMEQFMAQIAASPVSLTDELKKQTDVKDVVEVAEIKVYKEKASVAKKVETEEEKAKEDDFERTEISIMEATMDNNEWITDSNYQVLPWMNISVPSLAQDHTKPEQLPTEERQHISPLTDATCINTDTTPSTEVKQTSTLSLVDENAENNKKVAAVQPMSQNVNVTFRIHYLTHSPYQTVAVTGNQQELGNWKEFIPLERTKDGHWATVVSLPAESHVEWKFVVVDKGEVCRWEECGNRLLDTGFGDDLIVHKWWGFL
ncbi:dentin sialophosphoprotein [Toxotes jaculatrix]|uniref:dentin sialophosphoprotein n=1 Tax=Toxotes jaculatrix TaxID=941984 RepID=UPI001B3AAB65|nr:dentin sialophosphoprotein [Toxotes jaculatrix]